MTHEVYSNDLEDATRCSEHQFLASISVFLLLVYTCTDTLIKPPIITFKTLFFIGPLHQIFSPLPHFYPSGIV